MVKPRKEDMEYRNIRLRIESYKRLETRLLKYIQREKDPKMSFDRALNLLMDDLDKREKEWSKHIDDLYRLTGKKPPT